MSILHPNSHLPAETIEYVLCVAANAFRRCHMQPSQAEYQGCDSLLYGELGAKRFLVYVRITRDDEQETGTGPVPGVLIDAAAEYDAEPHLMRIHITTVGEGYGFQYWGYKEFIEHVLAHDAERAATLLAPRTFQDYVGLLKGRISTMELDLRMEKPNERWLTLKVDGEVPYGSAICTASLLDSTRLSDDFYIFTCTCGHAGCNGIFRGVRVVHQGAHTLWKAYHAKGRKLFLFDREQYRTEILRGCKEVVEFLRKHPENFCSPVESLARRKWLERAYFQATGEA